MLAGYAAATAHGLHLFTEHQRRCRLMLLCMILPVLLCGRVGGQHSDNIVCGGLCTFEGVAHVPPAGPEN